MKTALVLLLIFIAFDSVRSASKSPVFDRIPEVSTNDCSWDWSVQQELFKDDFKNFPVESFKKLTIAFNNKTNLEDCDRRVLADEAEQKTLFEISITKDGVERKLIEVVVEGEDVVQKVFTTDAAGTRTQAMTFEVPESRNRVAFSIDLEKGVLSGSAMIDGADEFYSVATKNSLNYGSLAFDGTIKISLNGMMRVSDLIIEYDNYYPETSLFQLMLVPQSPSVKSSYDMTKGSGLSLADSQQNGFGTLYFGTNSEGTNVVDANTNPSWSTNGIEFSKTTQYAKVLLEEPFYGAKSDLKGWIYSTTFSFWINLKEKPTTSQNIIRFKTDAEEDSFAVGLDDQGKLVSFLDGTLLATSTDSLPVGEWTLVTVNIGYYFEYFGVSTIYFGNTLQSPELSFVEIEDEDGPPIIILPPIILPPLRLLDEEDEPRLHLGGFIGEIQSLQILAPGAAKVNFPSSTEGCLVDFGLDSPVCLTPNNQCPNGKDAFPCSTGEEEEEIKEKDDDDGLSGGAIAGIVIGSVTGVSLLGTAVYLVTKGKMGGSGAKSKKPNNMSKVAETHTERASFNQAKGLGA